LAVGAASGTITLGSNLSESGQTLNVNIGVAELLQGSSVGSGTITVGSGLNLSGTTNPTLSNSGVVSFGGDTGTITLGPSLAMSGQTLNVQGIGTIQAVVGGAAQGASTLNAGPNITLSGTSPQVTISASGGASAALVVENQGTSLGSATTLNSSAPVTIALASSIASVGVNALSVSSGSASAAALVQLNASGDVDVSMMPIGGGSPNLIPISGAATLGLILGGTPTAATLTANRQVFYPFTVSRPLIFSSGGSVAPNIFSQLGAKITTAVASSTFSVGIYADNGNAGGAGNQPTGSPILSASGMSGAATGIILGTVAQSSVTLEPGNIYWLSLIPSAALGMNCAPSGGLLPLGLTTGGAIGNYYYLTGSGSTLIAPVSGTFTAATSTYPPVVVFL
jgi:hypothetical protein